MVGNLIVLYDASETEFTSNGIGSLNEAISCIVTEEINGIFELKMEYPISGRHFKDLKYRNIILAKPDKVRRSQPFRIYQISSSMNNTVTVNAKHVSYDLDGYMMLPFSTSIGKSYDFPEETDSASAMANFRYNMVTPPNNILGPLPFTFSTTGDLSFSVGKKNGNNLLTTGKGFTNESGIYYIYEMTYTGYDPPFIGLPGSVLTSTYGSRGAMMSVKQFLLGEIYGEDGLFLDAFGGGEFEWDRFNVILHKYRGRDSGFTVEYGKNMIDFQQEKNFEGIYTAVQPYMLINTAPTATMKKDLNFTTSWDEIPSEFPCLYRRPRNDENAIIRAPGDFDYLRILPVGFSDSEIFSILSSTPNATVPVGYDNSLEGLKSYDEICNGLDAAAQQYIEREKIAEPKVSISVSFADFQNSIISSIKKLHSDEIALGDMVHVYFPRYGIKVDSRITSIEYDVKKDTYENLQIGQSSDDLSSEISGVNASKKLALEVPTLSKITGYTQFSKSGTVKVDLPRCFKSSRVNGSYSLSVWPIKKTVSSGLITDQVSLSNYKRFSTSVVEQKSDYFSVSGTCDEDVNNDAVYGFIWTIDGTLEGG